MFQPFQLINTRTAFVFLILGATCARAPAAGHWMGLQDENGPGADAMPMLITHEHVDLGVTYQPEELHPLRMAVHDEDRGVEIASTHAVLVVPEAAMTVLPPGFELFGEAGSPIWILPQIEEAGRPFVGLSSEEIPPNVFADPLTIAVTSVQGPGHFFGWQVDAGGNLSVRFSSRDGFDNRDRIEVVTGGHQHLNLGFTSNGVYQVTFQVSGRRVGEAEPVTSLPTRFTFHILPLPPARPSSFQTWQSEQWPGILDPGVTGPDADPDHDGQNNLVEYALGLDPVTVDPPQQGVPSIALEHGAGSEQLIIQMPRAAAATDIEYVLREADDLAGPWASSALAASVTPAGNGRVLATFFDTRAIALRARKFYRVEVRLLNQP
jgi:surface-anchored protein